MANRPSSTDKLRRRREKLWNANPLCFWCQCVTVLPPPEGGNHGPPNEATIEHLRCKLDPDRGSLVLGSHFPQTVLACKRCNNEHNRMEEWEAGKEELQRRAKSPEASKEKLLEVLKFYSHEIRRYRKTMLRIARWKTGTADEIRVALKKAAKERTKLAKIP